MPRGDRTGPAGMGPMTGRAAGYCAGYDRPGFANPVPGRGPGFGRGLGRGFGRGGGIGRGLAWRFGYAPAPVQTYAPYQRSQAAYTKEDEKADLRAEKELIERDIRYMREGLSEIDKRLKELEKGK